jgi:hypothetical protein
MVLAFFLRCDKDEDASSSSTTSLLSGLWPSDDVDVQDWHLPSQGTTLMLPSPSAPLMLPPWPLTLRQWRRTGRRRCSWTRRWCT